VPVPRSVRSKVIAANVLFTLSNVTVYTMFTGPVSFPFCVTLRLAVALSLSVIVAVALAVPIVTSPLLGFDIWAITVSVSASNNPSFVTVTVTLPVEEPTATLIAADPPKAV